jgi:integrase/recombinase XerD
MPKGLRADDPCEPLRGPKKPKPLPKVMDEDAVDRLLGQARLACEQPDLSPSRRLKALRLRALLELLYATGLRVSELVSLPRSVAGGAEAFMVRGKGGRERLVPLTPLAQRAMAAYLEALDADKRCQHSRFLFPADSAEGHLTRQAFARELKQLGLAAGLNAKALSPMCCAMPLPAIFWPMARICARCSRCSATRTLPRRRSIPMCSRNACTGW